MKKQRRIIVMGMIFSLFSVLGFTGCAKNDFNPAPDAQIVEMDISFSGMTRDSHYYFSLRTDKDTVIFNGEYITFNDEGEMITHSYEDVLVEPSYMDELRKIAEQNDLIAKMKKYREPKWKPELLDGDMKSTTIIMSDNTRKNAPTIFDSIYHSFFASIAEKYSEFDRADSATEPSE